MLKKTYGAPRYMDWVAQIKAGSATVKVHFTGGALTVYGVTPAEYTTTNEFVQRVIEQSDYYKEGRIVLLREVIIGDKKRSITKKKALEAKDEKPKDEKPKDEDASSITDEDVAERTEKADTVEAEEVVPVSCLQDAQAYLQEHYGIAAYKVRTCEAAQKAANGHGVRFEGGSF